MKDTFAFSKRDALRQLGSTKRLEEFTIKYKIYPANKNKMEQVVLPIKNIKTAKTFNLRYKKKKSKIGFENQFIEWE